MGCFEAGQVCVLPHNANIHMYPAKGTESLGLLLFFFPQAVGFLDFLLWLYNRWHCKAKLSHPALRFHPLSWEENICWSFCGHSHDVKFHTVLWPSRGTESVRVRRKGRWTNRHQSNLLQPNTQTLCELSSSHAHACLPILPCCWASVTLPLVPALRQSFLGCLQRTDKWVEETENGSSDSSCFWHVLAHCILGQGILGAWLGLLNPSGTFRFWEPFSANRKAVVTTTTIILCRARFVNTVDYWHQGPG